MFLRGLLVLRLSDIIVLSLLGFCSLSMLLLFLFDSIRCLTCRLIDSCFLSLEFLRFINTLEPIYNNVFQVDRLLLLISFVCFARFLWLAVSNFLGIQVPEAGIFEPSACTKSEFSFLIYHLVELSLPRNLVLDQRDLILQCHIPD